MPAEPVPMSYVEGGAGSGGVGSWRYDPLASPDWDSAGTPGALCTRRVKKDLSTIFTEPLPGIFAVPQDDNLFLVHCLIVGPFDTPYEGGFFHFVVRFGPRYPIHPPRVRLLTTGGGKVRFNPNLYKNGKICLSILGIPVMIRYKGSTNSSSPIPVDSDGGTWRGPAWSPAANLSSVLLSLQSLLNENPYHNEPGFEQERNTGDSNRYNTVITHETLRVAVVEQLENLSNPPTAPTTAAAATTPAAAAATAAAAASQVPPELKRVMETSFLEYFDHYSEVCLANIHKDGSLMEDPFGEIRGRFSYLQILKRLRRLRNKLKTTILSQPTDKSPLTSESEEEEEEEEDSGSGAVSSGGAV
ncbi:ubiquitin-conjugating enzyme E2 Z-like [Portunus trituberculatus]|uniref:ubiquitin-conjugating enzyme E2 Z-like n=1 Tax=Portunus trituberculatus TaxID=210409 RepID=UPI001E1CC24A|nr:ubiquitin-conjugating enzyme E2 Z-like [Portunus trituberculatus]